MCMSNKYITMELHISILRDSVKALTLPPTNHTAKKYVIQFISYYPSTHMRERGQAIGSVYLSSSVIKNFEKSFKRVIYRQYPSESIRKQLKSPQKIDMCVPNSDQNDSCLRMSSSFLFNIGKVRHFNTVKNRIRQRPGICGLLTCTLTACIRYYMSTVYRSTCCFHSAESRSAGYVSARDV